MKNLRHLLFSSVVVFASVCGYAQEQETTESSSRDAKKKIVPGLKVGITRSNVYDRQGEAFVSEGRNGFAAGLSLALPLGSLLGIQPEVILLQKGFEGAGRMYGENYMINRSTTHVDIPVQLQFKPFKWLTFLGGPQWSFVISQNDDYSNNNPLARLDFEQTDLRKNLFGTLLGFDINFGHVVFSGRSGWDVSANMQDGSSTVPRYRNRWLIWALGYRFY